MAYKSVLWTAKTPITYDRLAQMQENMNELRSMLEGNQTYVQGTPMGSGKGIMHLQELTNNISVPNSTFVNIGDAFTPVTESGRRYLFEVYIPQVQSYTAGVFFRMKKGSEVIQEFIIGMASNADLAYIVSVGGGSMSANFYAGSGSGAIHLAPGFSTNTSYSVDAIALFSYTNGLISNSATKKAFIKFSDVGPAF